MLGLSTREAFGQALVEMGAKYPDLVVLQADGTKSTQTIHFAERYPSRFVNVGIAEQNLMGAAAGLASTGMRALVSTYGVFASMRACEQVRTFIAYPYLNVTIASSHAGVTPGSDGPTHQATEDIGIFRTIPGMTIVMPADEVATKVLLDQALAWEGPVYVRLTRGPVPIMYSQEQKFALGKAIQRRDGTDLTIIALGDMLCWAEEAARRLEREGIQARVLDMHTVKPMDKAAVLRAAEETGAIVTVEDHNIINGLGGAVAETVSDGCPVPVKRIGLADTFAESGAYEKLLTKYRMNTEYIVRAAYEVLKMKK